MSIISSIRKEKQDVWSESLAAISKTRKKLSPKREHSFGAQNLNINISCSFYTANSFRIVSYIG